MATKANIKARTRGNPDPKWSEWETMNGKEYHNYRRSAIQYYYSEYKTADLMADVYAWMKENKYTAEDIKFAKSNGSSGMTQTAIIARCLRTGMPDFNPKHNEHWQVLGGTSGEIKPVTNFVKERIAEAIAKGKAGYVEPVEVDPDAPKAYVPSIQERVRDAAWAMTDEIEDALELFNADMDAFDPKLFNMLKLLRGKQVKAAHARIIKDLYVRQHEELAEANGTKDEQLKEAYAHMSKANLKKITLFYQEIVSACDMLAQEAKVNRKPKARKAKPVEKIIGKLKYAKTHEPLKLVSVNPADIIGSKELWIYNVKTRKLGKYVAAEFHELGVKGTTITGFNETLSVQKTLRKPEDQFKEFKAAGKVQLRKFLDDIKAVDIKLNGRINEDTVLLKVQ